MREKRFADTWRRGLGLALVLVLWLSPGAHARTPDQGMLWEITGKGRISHLFGTVHLDDPRVTALSANVGERLEAASRFVMEMVLDPIAVERVQQAMFFSDGRRLDHVLPPEEFRHTVAALADYGLPEAVVATMRPWAAMMTLAVPPSSAGPYLDQILMERARERGISVHGLETPAEQIAVFGELPLPDQLILLEDSLAGLDRRDALVEEMIQLYVEGDLQGLMAFQERLLAEGDARASALFRERAIRDRNHRMLRRMLRHLMVGDAFIAVGALHLPGPEGLIALLREQGYRVEAVR